MAAVGDPFDVQLVDTEYLAELELTISLMIAANESPGQLRQEQIDRILHAESSAEPAA
jgi:hypothetical protein